jgi:hypothetical protein
VRRLPKTTCATSRKRCQGTPDDPLSTARLIRQRRCFDVRQAARQVHQMTGIPCTYAQAWGRWQAISVADKQRAILRGSDGASGGRDG